MKGWLKRALVAFCSATLALTAGLLVGCSSCGDKKCDEHSWEEKVIVAATCTGDGKTERTCTECGTSETITVKGGHKYKEVVVEATCTTRGSTTYTCESCGDTYQGALVNPTGHQYKATEHNATCTAQGYIEYTCACGDSYMDITADKKGHNTLTAEWTITGEEQVGTSCEWVQYEEAICADCGERVEHQETIEKHTYAVSITKNATCSEEGEKQYACGCGDSYTQPIAIVSSAHAWIEGETNSSTGITTWACSHNSEHTKTSFSAKDKTETTVPAAAIQDAKEIELQKATLELPQEVKNQLTGDVDLSVDTLSTEDKNSAMAGLSQEEQAKLQNTEIFNFQMSQGSNAVTKFDKAITVTIPYALETGADPADIAVWYIDDAGKLTSIQATYSVVDGQGYATFETDHFSYYTVVRLSAKERCALYGCEDKVTVIAATCETDGYTLTKCARCNKTTRSAFVKALGHTYSENTVAPTCTAKGYTTYTCTRTGCGHSYAAKWVDMLAHDYTETVVEPTCTGRGYTEYTCKGCGDHYIDKMVDANGHDYNNGVCASCGKVDPSYVETDELNFYFNAIEGLLNAETYYVEIKNLQIDMIGVEWSHEFEDVKYDIYTRNMLVDLQGEVGIDENGYLVGEGIVTSSETERYENGETYEMSMTGKSVFRNGKIYVSATMMDNYEGVAKEQTMTSTVSQDAVLEMMGINSVYGMLMGFEPDENILGIIESIKGTPSNPLNQAIAKVMEYVFTKVESADGYRFELNFDRLTEVYEILTEKNLGEIIDLVLEEGAFDSICNYLVSTVDKQVSAVVEDVRKALALCGVDLEVVYDIVNAIMSQEQEGFDVRQYVAQFSTMKVSDLLDGMNEEVEPGTMDYAQMIMQYAAMVKEMTMMDIFGAMGGEGHPSGGSGSITDKPNYDYGEDMNPDYGEDMKPGDNEDIDREEDKIMKTDAAMGMEEDQATVMAAMYEQLVEIVTILKKSSISFNTDSMGEVLYYTVDLVNFGQTKTIDEIKAEIEAEEDEHAYYNGMDTSSVMLNGKMLLKPNGTMTGSFDNIVMEGEKAETVVQGFWKALFEGKVEGGVVGGNALQRFRGVYKDAEDGEIFEIDWVDKTGEPEEGTYAGQKAFKMDTYGYFAVATTPSAIINTENHCLEWMEYSISGMYYYDAEFTIWMNEKGEVIGLEFDKSELEEGRDVETSGMKQFFYNAATGAYVEKYEGEQNMHSYVLKEHKPAVGCEGEGYYKYTCTLCGEIKYNYYTNGHKTTEKLVLSEGAKTCEDGIDKVWICTICNKITDRWSNHYQNHELIIYNKVVATTKCGDVVMRGHECLCGMNKGVDDVYGPCEFDLVDAETKYFDDTDTVWDHYIKTYRCAVTACAYTYTYETYEKREGCHIYEYYIYRYGVKEGTDNVDYTYQEKSHYNTSHLAWHNDNTDDGTGLYTVHNYCSACNEVDSYYQARYDARGNRTYYKNLMEGAEEEWEASYENNPWGWMNYYKDLTTGKGYRRTYTGCEYKEYDLNGNFRGEGDMHWWHNTKNPYSDSCTQYQYSGYIKYCYYCRTEYRDGGYSMPKDHDYDFNEDLGMYVCKTCGMKNETGADAIVIEDLTEVDLYNCYAVGYYNRNHEKYQVMVVVNYGMETDVYLDSVSCEDRTTHENSGIIRINMEELEEAIKSLQENGVEVETISLVMQYYDPQSGDYDETTGEWEGTWIDCVITFE